MGRWSPPALADESSQALKDAGATLVATTLAQTRDYLEGLVAGELKFAATTDSESQRSLLTSA
jgi:hypothetical protein